MCVHICCLSQNLVKSSCSGSAFFFSIRGELKNLHETMCIQFIFFPRSFMIAVKSLPNKFVHLQIETEDGCLYFCIIINLRIKMADLLSCSNKCINLFSANISSKQNLVAIPAPKFPLFVIITISKCWAQKFQNSVCCSGFLFLALIFFWKKKPSWKNFFKPHANWLLLTLAFSSPLILLRFYDEIARCPYHTFILTMCILFQILKKRSQNDSDKKALESGLKMLTDEDQMGVRFKFQSFFPAVLKDYFEKNPVSGFFSNQWSILHFFLFLLVYKSIF